MSTKLIKKAPKKYTDAERKKKYPYAFAPCACGCGEILRHDAKTAYKRGHDKGSMVISKVVKKAKKTTPPKPEKAPPKKKTQKKVEEKPVEKKQMRSRVVFALDHSGSMAGITREAMADFNETLQTIKDKAMDLGIETRISLVQFGLHGGRARTVFEHLPLSEAKPLDYYPAENGTPLYDGVHQAIDIALKSPDAKDPNTSYLVVAITDGQENQSRPNSHVAGQRLQKRIQELQGTDKWTFAFRVPRGRYKEVLVRSLGIFPGNVQEWDVSSRGLREATMAHTSSMGSYFTGVSLGTQSTRGMYQVDVRKVNTKVLRSKMRNITNEVEIWFVKNDAEGGMIRDFCNRQLKGESFRKGCAYYLLDKKTVLIQEYKGICIRDKKSGDVYTGMEARQLLGIPEGRYNLKPGDHGQWDIYVQSTSVNRRLFGGQTVLYWRGAGR